MSLLVFAEEFVFARIEEVGVRVESAGRPRNGAFIDGLVGIDFVGEVLLD